MTHAAKPFCMPSATEIGRPHQPRPVDLHSTEIPRTSSDVFQALASRRIGSRRNRVSFRVIVYPLVTLRLVRESTEAVDRIPAPAAVTARRPFPSCVAVNDSRRRAAKTSPIQIAAQLIGRSAVPVLGKQLRPAAADPAAGSLRYSWISSVRIWKACSGVNGIGAFDGFPIDRAETDSTNSS